MQLKCPKCLKTLNEEYRCSNDHVFELEAGVLRLMTDDFKQELTNWLKSFEDHRKHSTPSYSYDLLPNAGYLSNNDVWKARGADLSMIEKHINSTTKNVLDVGSWNGWLANRLSKQGLDVTAIDYFLHENDGLKARNQYKDAQWRSIQMDIESLDVFGQTFDLIVINRMIPYVSDPKTFIESCKQKLSKNGILIITGINVSYGNSTELAQMRGEKVQFQEKYNTSIQFRPSKGFVDTSDLTFLETVGFSIQLYPGIKNWLKKFVFKKRHASFYGVYHA